MALDKWLDEGRLAEHDTSAEELQEVWTIVHRDITDASAEGISTDRRFMAAYNAALQIATIVLYCHGYRARGPGHHYITFQVLPDILGEDFAELATYFDTCRTKRNRSQYDRTGEISRTEVSELIEAARDFRDEVKQWIASQHPELVLDE